MNFHHFALLDGKCLACSACYVSCIRLLGHLADYRRTRCAEVIRRDPDRFRLEESIVAHGDDIEWRQRHAAKKSGLQKPAAVGIVRRDGQDGI